MVKLGGNIASLCSWTSLLERPKDPSTCQSKCQLSSCSTASL